MFFGLGLSVMPAARAVNLMVNGEFDEGLAGWDQTGTVFTTGETGILSDQGGMRVVLFQSVVVPVETTVSLTLSFDFFNALSPVVGLGQTPDTVFGSAYIGGLPFGPLYEEGVYDDVVGLLDADYRGSVNLPPGLVVTPSPKGAGWERYTVPLAVVAHVTVAFEFIDGNGLTGDSSAAFDNVFLMAEPIPEPRAAGLLLAAAGWFVLRRRRRRYSGRGPPDECSPRQQSAFGDLPRRGVGWLAAAFMFLAGAAGVLAQEPLPPPLDAGLVRVSAKAERSTLNRISGELASTVDIEVENIGTQRIDGPVHALVRFRDAGTGVEVRTGITLPHALGGFDQAPHQVPYFDLSAQVADGWMPAETVSFTLVFMRARTLNVLYEVSLAGRVNSPPSVDAGGPYLGRVGEPIVFEATASDPDGDPLAFAWDFGDGGTATTARAEHIYATAGAKTVRVSVTDGRDGGAERDVTAIVIPDGDFALAHTRIVDGIGHPIGGAIIEETGPGGQRTLVAADSGFTSLGDGAAGDHAWKFSAPGHRPVWRTAVLTAGEVRLIPSPWLAREAEAVSVSILDATVLTAGSGPGAARIDFPEGAFAQPGTARLTGLGPQSLPFPLPFGWSPLGAMHIEFSESPVLPGQARLQLTDVLSADEFLTLVRYDDETRAWRILEAFSLDPARPDIFNFALDAAGTYAAVIRDRGPGAPLPGDAGEALRGGASPSPTTRVAAASQVDPSQRAASLDPEAVTAQAQAVFTPATGVLLSGSWFRIGVQETYDMTDGAALRTPDYDATVFAYRRPAATIAPVESLDGGAPGEPTITDPGEGRPAAFFPLRPQILFGPADLQEARVRVEVLPPLGDGAAALSAQGGVLESGDVRVTVPPGALDGFAAGSLRRLDPAGFAALAGPEQAIVRAFDLNLGRLLEGAALELSLGAALAPDAAFVLARLVRFPGGSGLAPVQRFRTNATGSLTSVEPDAAPRLPGFTGPGQYLLVQLAAPPTLVTGRVFTATGVPAPGIGVRIASQRWLSVTAADARYFLLAPAGPGIVLASHPTDGDGAAAGFTAGEVPGPIALDLTLGALAPRILATTPPDAATRVNTVTPVTVEFSERIAPASLGPAPIALRAESVAGDVPGGATLDLGGRFLTFLPTSPLDPGVTYSLTVAADIHDLQNLPLEGARTFSFVTAPLAARDTGARLTIYEPGAAKVPADILAQLVGYRPGAGSSHVVAHGGPGAADPDVPVILVNESTSETATVLSRPDGSFVSFIDAEESDYVSAVFVNANGTRVTVPATKQRFDDGRTGLYRQGGILEAESEDQPVEIIVEPGAVATRTIFTVEEMGLSEVHNLLDNVEPADGGKVLGGLRYAEQGDPIALAADVVFPLRPGDIPDGVDPANATFALTIPMQVDGVTTFQVIDAMEFEPDGASGRLVTRSPPFVGLLLRQINALRRDAVFTDTFSRVATAGFGTAAAEANVVGAFLVPILVAPVVGQKVAGKVITLRDGEISADGNGEPLRGAFVRLETGLGAVVADAPGLFRQGETFAMSDADGRFAFNMPTSFNRRLVATHARFPFQRAASAGIPTGEVVARATLIFRQPPPIAADIEDTAAPLVTIAQSPVVVPSGLGEADGAILTIGAVDDLGVASLNIERDAFLGTTNGEVLDIGLLLAPVLTGEHQPAPGRLQLRYRIQAAEKGAAIYRIRATDAAGNLTVKEHVVVFGDPAPGGGTAASRRLANVWPPDGATGQALGVPIRLRFNLPLEPADLTGLDWITIGPPGAFTLGAAEPSPDRRELTLRYFVHQTDASELTLNFDTSRVNQTPGNRDGAMPVAYRIEFAAASGLTVQENALTSGAGVVMLGRFVYSLDRDGVGGSVRVHELLENGTLAPRQTEAIPERPADLVAIPAYAMREFDGTVRAPESWLAVFSGGALDVKRLALYRIQPDGRLARAFTARPPISLGISQVVKAKWDPPFLAFQELTSENTSVSLLNLNAFYIGFRLSQTHPDILRTLPVNGRPGADLNNDGDFADEGEVAPLPASRDGQVFGLEFSWAPLDPAERLRDFDFSADFGLLGGVFSGPAGNGLMMALGRGALLDDSTARVLFPEDPKRLTFLPRLPLLVDGQPRLTDVALVSTVAFGDAKPALLVIDLTNPAAPTLLGRALLPAGAGSLNTIVLRDDGLLALATTSRGVLLLDPRLLLQTNADGLTAALVKQIPGLSGGGERAFTADASGLSLSASGTSLRAALDAPLIDVVTIDLPPFDSARWRESSVFAGAGGSDGWNLEERMAAVLAGATRVGTGFVFPATAAAAPDDPDPRNHYYITVRAPGVIGPTLELAAAAVDRAGRPTLPTTRLAAPTFLGHEEITARFAALAAFNAAKALDFSGGAAALADVLEVSIATAFDNLILEIGGAAPKPRYATDLAAHRISDDPAHPLFNTYLAGPIVLLSDDLSVESHGDLVAQLDRRFLAASAGFWVGISPRLGPNDLLHSFASRQEESVRLALDAGFDLHTLMNGLDILASLIGGNRIGAIQTALDFIDAELERALQPGINAYVHVGAGGRNPLVFVPGVMASELERAELLAAPFDLWVPIVAAVVQNLIPFFQPLDALVPGSGANVVPSDVLRSIQLGLASVDIQEGFLSHLRDELGYSEYTWDYSGVNVDALRLDGDPDWDSLSRLPELFPFPYDWRQDNALTAQRLADYIDLILTVHADAPNVDIVAHSMGGLVARRYMIDHPGRVGKFVSVASPFLGAPKAVATMKTGDLGELALNFLVPADLSIRIARRMPALHQLMPNRGLFDLGFRPLVESGWDIDANGRAYDKLGYGAYRAALDGPLFRDFAPDRQPAFPRPIESHNEPFHQPAQYDWRGDTSGASLFHIVAVQQLPRTVGQIELLPAVVPSRTARPDIGLAFPPVPYLDAERPEASAALIDPVPDLAIKPGDYELSYSMRLRRTAGDGTVPFLSATRGYGAGGVHDLNSPRAVMAAIVSEGTSDAQEKAASHVDVLRNPKLLKLLERILTKGLAKPDLPTLRIEVDPPVPNEGEPVDFRVDIGGATPPDEVPVIVWETGDGRTLNTVNGSHIYADSGLYTLSCAVYYPKSGLGTVASHALVVANVPPAIQLVATPENARPGEVVTLRVDRSDTGLGDEHEYRWSFDGVDDAAVPATAFLARRSHQLPGSYSATVRVTDNNGATATASTTYRVGSGFLPRVFAEPISERSLLADPPEFEPLEFMQAVISGHDTSQFATVVRQDGGLATNTLLGVLMDFRAIVQELNGQGEETLTIYREGLGGGALPQECSIRVTATGPRVLFRVRHVPADGAVRSFVWEVPSTPGEGVTLTLRWNDLPTLEESAMAARTSPAAAVARVVATREGDSPTVTVVANQSTGVLTLTSEDRNDGEDPTLVDQAPLALVDTLLDDDPTTAFDERTTLEGAPVTLLDSTTQLSTTLPTGAPAILAIDSRLETTLPYEPPVATPLTPPLTEADAAAVRQAVRQTFDETLPVLRLWVIDMSDLLVLEQGSGAGLWKGELADCPYVPGQSDNDYEIFLPAFKNPVWKLRPDVAGVPIDFFDEQQQAAFPKLAHLPEYLWGDWYFNPPVGVDAAGNEMGIVPDIEDEDAWEEYLFIAQRWRYKLPVGVTATLCGAAGGVSGFHNFFEVEKGTRIGDLPLFDHPVTPAEVIAAALTDTVRTNPAIEEKLKEVTFFPARREHFFFGVPSIERPPAFGDDPIGDAGLGRGLLFLKWVLEGVFINPFAANHANLPIPGTDAGLRAEIFERLKSRQAAFAMEAYEWGLLQEYSLLRESAHLVVKRTGEAADQPAWLPDGLATQENKIMKKVGKAVIRAVLGRLMATVSTREAIFAVTPAAFDADADLRTFEHLVARVAIDHPGTAGLDPAEISHYLGAKLGDAAVFESIRASADGVPGFIERGFAYLISEIQERYVLEYADFLDALVPAGRIDELAARTQNARIINHGLITEDQERPGRADLHGLEGAERARYSFHPALHKRGFGPVAPGPVDVLLVNTPGPTITLSGVQIPPSRNMVMLDQKRPDGLPFFTIERSISPGSVATHSLSLAGPGMANDRFTANNLASFESRFLVLDTHFPPRFAPVDPAARTRWVFRGLRLADAGVEALELLELERGVHESAAVRAGVDVAARVRELSDGLVDLGDFTQDDALLFSDVERAALSHVGGVASLSPGISTSERAIFPLTSGLVNNVVFPQRAWLLVMEVPLEPADEFVNRGIEYLPTANGAQRRINDTEGNEVVYIGVIRFRQAHLFEILPVSSTVPPPLPASNVLIHRSSFHPTP